MRTVGWTALFTGKGLTEEKGRGVMREREPRRLTAVMRGWLYRVKRAERVGRERKRGREREREKARFGTAGDKSGVVAVEKLRETETWPNRN